MPTRGPDIRIYLGGDATAFVQMLTRANRSLDAFKLAAGGAGVFLGVNLGQSLVDATAQAISFESAFTGVEKTLNDADFNAPTINLLDSQLRQLSQTIPVAYEELARIGELGGQLGVRAASLDEFTDTIAKLGATTVLSVDQAALEMARFVNIIEGSDADPEAFERIGSVLVELGNNAAVLEDELLAFSFRIGQVGSIVGLSADQVLAFAARLGEMGVEVEAGGNAVSRVFLEMQDAVLSGSDELAVFAATAGVSVSEFATLFQDDASAALFAFLQGLEQVIASGGNVSQVLEDVGFNTIRIRQTLLSLSRDTPRLAELLQLSSDEAGNPDALATEAARRFDDTRESLVGLRNEVQLLGATVAEDMLPAINAVVAVLDYLIGSITEVAAVGGPVPALMLATASAVLIVSGAFTILNGVLGITRARMQELAAASALARASMVAFPAAMAVIAGVAVAGAIMRLTAETEHLTEGLDEAAQRGTELAAALESIDRIAANRAFARAVRLVDEYYDAVQATADAQARLNEVTAALEENPFDFAAIEDAQAIEAEIVSFADAQALLRTELAGISDLSLEAAQRLHAYAAVAGADAGTLELLASNVAGVAYAAEQAAEAEAEAAKWMEAYGYEAEQADKKIVSLSDAIERLAGPEVGFEQANIRFQRALNDLSDQILATGGGLSLLTEAGLDNRQALLDAAQSAIDTGGAYAEMTGSLEEGRAVTALMIQQVLDTATAFGMSREEAVGYLRQLNLLPDDVYTRVLLNDDEALAEIAAIRRGVFSLPTRYGIAIDVFLGKQGGTYGGLGDVVRGTSAVAQRTAAAIGNLVTFINRTLEAATGATGGGAGGGGGGSVTDPFQETLEALDLLYEVGELSRSDYLATLEELLAREDRLSDRWVDVWRRRERLLAEITREEQDLLKEREREAAETQRAIEQVLAEADRVLRSRVEQIEAEFQQAQDRLRNAVLAANDIVDLFGSNIDVGPDEIVEVLEHRVEATERWIEAVAELRATGRFSEGLVNDLALAGPAAVNLAEALTQADATLDPLLARVDALGQANINANIGGFLSGATSPLGFTLGSQGPVSVGGSLVQIGPPQLTVNIDTSTFIGDQDALRDRVVDIIEPMLDEHTRQLSDALTGA